MTRPLFDSANDLTNDGTATRTMSSSFSARRSRSKTSDVSDTARPAALDSESPLALAPEPRTPKIKRRIPFIGKKKTLPSLVPPRSSSPTPLEKSIRPPINTPTPPAAGPQLMGAPLMTFITPRPSGVISHPYGRFSPSASSPSALPPLNVSPTSFSPIMRAAECSPDRRLAGNGSACSRSVSPPTPKLVRLQHLLYPPLAGSNSAVTAGHHGSHSDIPRGAISAKDAKSRPDISVAKLQARGHIKEADDSMYTSPRVAPSPPPESGALSLDWRIFGRFTSRSPDSDAARAVRKNEEGVMPASKPSMHLSLFSHRSGASSRISLADASDAVPEMHPTSYQSLGSAFAVSTAEELQDALDICRNGDGAEGASDEPSLMLDDFSASTESSAAAKRRRLSALTQTKSVSGHSIVSLPTPPPSATSFSSHSGSGSPPKALLPALPAVKPKLKKAATADTVVSIHPIPAGSTAVKPSRARERAVSWMPSSRRDRHASSFVPLPKDARQKYAPGDDIGLGRRDHRDEGGTTHVRVIEPVYTPSYRPPPSPTYSAVEAGLRNALEDQRCRYDSLHRTMLDMTRTHLREKTELARKVEEQKQEIRALNMKIAYDMGRTTPVQGTAVRSRADTDSLLMTPGSTIDGIGQVQKEFEGFLSRERENGPFESPTLQRSVTLRTPSSTFVPFDWEARRRSSPVIPFSGSSGLGLGVVPFTSAAHLAAAGRVRPITQTREGTISASSSASSVPDLSVSMSATASSGLSAVPDSPLIPVCELVPASPSPSPIPIGDADLAGAGDRDSPCWRRSPARSVDSAGISLSPFFPDLSGSGSSQR